MILLYICLLLMTLLGSVASLFLKKASVANNLTELITNINLYVGGFLYLSSAILNIWLLRYLDYSVVLPLTALTYVWTLIISHHFLGEKITRGKIIGTLFILLGAITLSI